MQMIIYGNKSSFKIAKSIPNVFLIFDSLDTIPLILLHAASNKVSLEIVVDHI